MATANKRAVSRQLPADLTYPMHGSSLGKKRVMLDLRLLCDASGTAAMEVKSKMGHSQPLRVTGVPALPINVTTCNISVLV